MTSEELMVRYGALRIEQGTGDRSPLLAGDVEKLRVDFRSSELAAAGQREAAVTDSTALMRRADSHARTGKAPAVPKKVRAAAERLATTPGPPDYAAIAAAVGWRDAHAARRALTLPQSVRFLQDYKRDLTAKINLMNPRGVAEVRDTSGNHMARDQAVRVLEAIEGNQIEQAGRMANLTGPGRGHRNRNPGWSYGLHNRSAGAARHRGAAG